MKYFCAFILCLFSLHCVTAQRRGGEITIGFEEAGRLAAAASVELKQLRAQRALREGAWALSLRAFLPQVSFAVSEDERLSLMSADSFTKTYSINLEQLVFDGGRTRTARKAEQAGLILLSDDLKRNESAVVEAALSFYRQILLSRMIIAIREKALVSLKEQRRILSEELALGLVIPLDLLQAEITVREAELELQSMKIQNEELEKQFADFLGLDAMPELSEQIDIYRSAVIPDSKTVYRFSLGRNPDLQRIYHSIMQKEVEAKYASRSWIPTLKAMGSYSVSGQHYPLNRQSWTAGISFNFASPWFSASAGGNAGREIPYNKTARIQSSFSPLPDPASGLSAKQAVLALALEKENYLDNLEKMERQTALAINNLRLSEQRRCLAVESLKLAAEKYRLSEVLLSLGRITRLELMEGLLEYEKKEMAAVEASAALLETERSLERFVDLPPGSLTNYFNRYEQAQKSTIEE